MTDTERMMRAPMNPRDIAGLGDPYHEPYPGAFDRLYEEVIARKLGVQEVKLVWEESPIIPQPKKEG